MSQATTDSTHRLVMSWTAGDMDDWREEIRNFAAEFRRELSNALTLTRDADRGEGPTNSASAAVAPMPDELSGSERAGGGERPPSSPEGASEGFSPSRLDALKRQLWEQAERAKQADHASSDFEPNRVKEKLE
jgi:hypothetical protein